MIRALIIKELRQHWPVFLLLAAILAVGFLMIVSVVVFTEEGSLLEALRRFLWSLVVLALMVLGNRLVVREYQGKTQLFLEALPVTRLQMVTVKFFLGLLLIVMIVSAAFLVLLVAGQQSEVYTPRFLQIVAARTYAYILCVHSFFFLMGLLGRYRIVIYIVGIVSAVFIETSTKLELARFGPFALLDEQFAYERNQFPVTALAVTMGLAAAMMLTALGLSLVREGSVARLLAERMSHREKVFLTLFVLGFLVAISVYEEKAEKAPFDLPGAVVRDGAGLTVKVSAVFEADSTADRQLAEAVWRELRDLQAFLEMPALPPVFIVLRRDLDGDRYERAELEGAEGVLVRANFVGPDFDQRHFLAWLIRETLVVSSQKRLLWEPRLWVLDGFSAYWAARGGQADAVANTRQLALRAAYGSQAGFVAEDLDTWLSYRQRVGDDIAAAVAWSGLDWLNQHCGEPACQTFLRAVLRTDVPADIRGYWHDRRNPWTLTLAKNCGITGNQFTSQWLQHLESTRGDLAGDLAAIPRLTGELHFEPLSPISRKAVYRVTTDVAPETGRFQILHGQLEAMDTEVPRSKVVWEDWEYPADQQGELPGTFSRGARLYWTFATRSERLGCEIISGWRRQEVR